MLDVPIFIIHSLSLRQFLARTKQRTRRRSNDAIRILLPDLLPRPCPVLSNAEVPAVGEVEAAAWAKSILGRYGRHSDGRTGEYISVMSVPQMAE